MKGFVMLHRKLLINPIFENEKLLKVFIWCLLKASHKEHDQLVGLQNVKLKKGQFIYGRNKASEELKIKPSTLNDYMQALKTREIIGIKPNNKYSVVTIVNWELYQSENTKTNNKPTTKQQQTDTNNNGNNDIYNTIFSFWNDQKIIHHRKLTNEIKQAITKAIKSSTEEELILAIKRYSEMYHSDYEFCNYKWTLKDFLTRQKGYKDFLDEGSKWCNYITWKAQSKDNHKDNEIDRRLAWSK